MIILASIKDLSLERRMFMDYKIFIGLPAYNEEKSLPELFSKLIDFKNNIYENLEVIVVDDGSTDDTKKIIEEFCDKYSL